MPWWGYAIIIYVVLCTFIVVIRMIRIKINIHSDPTKARELAKKYYDKDFYTYNEYRDALEGIIKEHNDLETILALMNTYERDDKEYKKWREVAAKAGDFECILDHYGFSNFSVSSTAYAEIIEALNKVKINSDVQADALVYMKGLVHFQSGKIDDAEENFRHCANRNLIEPLSESQYMLMLCCLKKGNISEAEQLHSLLSSGSFNMPVYGYSELYKFYALNPDVKGGSNEDILLNLAESYICCPDANKDSLEYTKIQCFLGEKYWFGDDAGKYTDANLFLLSAANKGNVRAKEILEQYGVDGVLVELVNASDKTYHFLYGYELTASKRLFLWQQLFHAFALKKSLLIAEFTNEYKKSFHSLQNVVNGISQLYADSLAKMIDWGIRLLMHYGIDSYSGNDILEMCGDLSLLSRVTWFERQLDAIDNSAAKMNIKTAYTKATRGYWTGAGFGTTISGTIAASMKASVAAGVMNMGSGILHGIGDSIVSAINNSKLRGMEQKVFESPNTFSEFTRALESACLEIMEIFSDIIINEVFQPDEPCLDGKIIYKNENLAELDDKVLETKIQNHTNAQNWEYVYSLTAEQLRRNPLEFDIFKSFADLIQRLYSESEQSEESKRSIKEYAKDFRFDIE